MVSLEYTLIILSIILILGLVIPELFKRLKLPFITVLILLGAILGENGLGFVKIDPTVEFFGYLGSAFLMFMAGLEIKLSELKRFGTKIFIIALLNGAVPFLVGLAIARTFGYSWLTALIVGTVFISTSVAIAIPAIKAAGLAGTQAGKTMISAIVVEDVISLVLLAFIMQSVSPITEFPLAAYFILLAGSIIALGFALPKLAKAFLKSHRKRDYYETQLRFVLIILLSVLIFFSALGVHPILASFLVGVLLGEVITSRKLYSKLHTIGYGIFIPVFFFIIGMEMNLKLLFNSENNILLFCIIAGLIAAKGISGYAAGRITKYGQKDSFRFSILSTVQLTTTLAATYAAFSLQLIDTPLITALIGVSVVTTLLAPVALKALSPT